jgi:hypothetical protein
MSEINIKKTYDENDEQVYAETSIDAVVGLKESLEEIKEVIITIEGDTNEELDIIKKEIEDIKNESNKEYDDTEIQNKLLEMEKIVSSLNSEIKSLRTEIDLIKKEKNVEHYNIHLIKNKDKYYTVIENFDNKLLDDSKYRIVFMKKSRHANKGKRWTVPMFNDKSEDNYYLYDENKTLLTPNKAYWGIKDYKQALWNGNYNIKDLPCLNIQKDSSKFGKKTFSILTKENTYNPNLIYPIPIITYTTDQSYIFKNSSNKKIKIGFAIFKLNNNKWERISNISEMELYAYDINKYIVNMI